MSRHMGKSLVAPALSHLLNVMPLAAFHKIVLEYG
jgi:hypothetical protein